METKTQWRETVVVWATGNRRWILLSCGHWSERRRDTPVARQFACAVCRREAEALAVGEAWNL